MRSDASQHPTIYDETCVETTLVKIVLVASLGRYTNLTSTAYYDTFVPSDTSLPSPQDQLDVINIHLFILVGVSELANQKISKAYIHTSPLNLLYVLNTAVGVELGTRTLPIQITVHDGMNDLNDRIDGTNELRS